jgi:GntR family transcriptional regulator
MTRTPTTAQGVADRLRELIETGKLAAGEQIPMTAELAERYGVAKNTVVKAVQRLKAAGLLEGNQGARPRVRKRIVHRRLMESRYSRSRWQHGGQAILVAEAQEQGNTARQDVRELAEVPAPGVVAERLRIASGTPVWVRRRTTYINDRPNQLADSYYELQVVDTAPAIRQVNTGPGGGFARLEEAGFHLYDLAEEISARMPTSDEIELLDLSPGTPVFELVRTVYTDDDRPVEVMVAILAADMTSFSYRYPFPD